jgi:hypothetical protein
MMNSMAMLIEIPARLSTKRGGCGAGCMIAYSVKMIANRLATQLHIRITFKHTSYRSPR